MGRLLGIDYGQARIGLAVSDERQVIALPAGKIQVGKTLEETILLIQKQLLSYGTFDRIIIGLPLLLSGKEGEMALLVKKFGEALEKVFPSPIVYWDERLTSAQVEKMLKETGMNRKTRAKQSDTIAAVTILQNYLDSHAYTRP